MSLDAGSASPRADVERGLKIALALAVLVILVFSLVGPEGRRAQATADAQAAAESRPSDSGTRLPSVSAESRAGRVPPASLAEAPAGRVLPPPPVATPAPSANRLGGPRPTSVTAQAEMMGPPAPRLRLLPRPIAVDSATFQVGSGRLHLVGIEPLATSAVCGEGGSAWPCGMQARTALRGWLRSRSILCSVPDGFGRRDETIAARCQLGDADIAQWLVENGWARARDTSRYTIVEDNSRKAGRGMWRTGGPAAP